MLTLTSGVHSMKLRVLPGPPHSLSVLPEEEELSLENGQPLKLEVEVRDKAGNLANANKMNVVCKVGTRGFVVIGQRVSQT